MSKYLAKFNKLFHFDILRNSNNRVQSGIKDKIDEKIEAVREAEHIHIVNNESSEAQKLLDSAKEKVKGLKHRKIDEFEFFQIFYHLHSVQ